MTEARDNRGECQAAPTLQQEGLSVSSPSLRIRLAACAYYAGLYLFAFGMKQKSSEYLRLHREQSLALFAVLFSLAIVILAMIGGLSYVIAFRREWMQRFPVETWAMSVWRKSLLVWIVFWTYSFWGALRGSQAPVPFLGTLRRLAAVRITGLLASQLLFVAVVAVALLNIRAQMLLHRGDADARVYLIYEDLDRFPVWMFRTAFYPVIVAAADRWGPGSAALKPISKEAIREALSCGMFAFIGSHGTERGLLLEGDYFSPRDVPAPATHSRLQYVYLAGCDSGAQRVAWEEAMRPAEVKTYDRMTPVVEHLWWLWARGPDVIRNLTE